MYFLRNHDFVFQKTFKCEYSDETTYRKKYTQK